VRVVPGRSHSGDTARKNESSLACHDSRPAVAIHPASATDDTVDHPIAERMDERLEV
jgi:hypothetical protein